MWSAARWERPQMALSICSRHLAVLHFFLLDDTRERSAAQSPETSIAIAIDGDWQLILFVAAAIDPVPTLQK